jgi:hypothetical protein
MANYSHQRLVPLNSAVQRPQQASTSSCRLVYGTRPNDTRRPGGLHRRTRYGKSVVPSGRACRSTLTTRALNTLHVYGSRRHSSAWRQAHAEPHTHAHTHTHTHTHSNAVTQASNQQSNSLLAARETCKELAVRSMSLGPRCYNVANDVVITAYV